MPFYIGPDKTEIHFELDENFVIKNLAKCFTIDNIELSVFVLTPDNPYIEDLETINFINSDQIDVIIHPVVTHPWFFNNLREHFTKIKVKKPWLQITWDKTCNGSNYINFDYWAANLDDAIYSWGMSQYVNKQQPKRYIFSCLNNIAKAHRTVTLYNLFCDVNFRKCLVSLSDDYDLMYREKINKLVLSRDIREYSSNFNEQKFDEFYKLLPIKCPQEISSRIPFWVHDAYIDSYVNIVTEHDFTTDFVSEKSIKPFLTEQMPVFIAGANTVQHLRDLGLDVFDDYIDHSYDCESNPILRLNKVRQTIKKLLVLNWEKIYLDTRQRRTNNRNFLLSNNLINQFANSLRYKIEEVIKL